MIDFDFCKETQQVLSAKIIRTCKGGWICQIQNFEVFLPGSQLYNKIDDYNVPVGKNIKVLVIDNRRYTPVVSHKAFLSKFYERKKILRDLEHGQKLSGFVKATTAKGVYINVIGIIGFMPCKENESSTYSIGSLIDVTVSKSDETSSKLYLSPINDSRLNNIKDKHAHSNPNEHLRGSVVSAKVVRIFPTGYEVLINNEIPAVLPSSETPSNYKLEQGAETKMLVIEFDSVNSLPIVSINQLKNLKKSKLIKFLEESTNKVHACKVVFLEKDLVTVHFTVDGNVFSGYIKKADLAWENVVNTSDIVFLGEELYLKFLYIERGRPYFSLKWQQDDIYPKELFSMDTEELLSSLGVSHNRFYGKVCLLYRVNPETEEKEISGALVTNLAPTDDNDRNAMLADVYSGANISAFLQAKYAYGLKDGLYYYFTLRAAPSEQREEEHRPYKFIAKIDNALPVHDPYNTLVCNSFKENKTPKSNRESANYLKEIGADMYTDRDRMFYELLQNADDSSSAHGVKVLVQIKDNYLIFTHDGLSFSRQDFRSIVSTANSTKRLDQKKTGYKGIGFKSVFTDSEKVYIRTGGFFFMFDKRADLFNDFRAFYRYVNPLYNEDQLKIFFEENFEYEQEFEKVEHLPWQLLPFWVDKCPDDLMSSSFMRNCNVAIALDMGATAEKYKNTIKGIIEKPRFMLFLRNTLRIQYEEEKKWDVLSIAKHYDSISGVVALKNSFDNSEQKVSYIVKDSKEISVSNEAFKECGIPLEKVCTSLAGREKWQMYQLLDGSRIPITSIPERIIAADTTSMQYAFMLDDNNQVTNIPDKTPSLYAYLPMEDRRYLFPFFINADFELSSNRQEAKRVSLWNEYLFYCIGRNIVSWAAALDGAIHKSYLKLLPKYFFAEELEEGKTDKLAYQFNRGYKESLLTTPFILNDNGVVVKQDEIIIDESGFSKVIGTHDFCSLFGKSKHLPSLAIDETPLENETIFTAIEHVQTSEVVDYIVAEVNRYKILKYWLQTTSQKRNDILSHVVSMPKNKKHLFTILKEIPCYTCGNRLLSFNKILASDKFVLNLSQLVDIRHILEKLGFELTTEYADNHLFTEHIKDDIEGYKQHLFDITSKVTSQSNVLTPQEKFKLFSFFGNSKFGLKPEQISSWKIFCNQNDDITPLSQLTHIDSTLYGGITKAFVIKEDEFAVAPKQIAHYMMKEKNQYNEIVLKQWATLAALVSNQETQACNLYLLANRTFLVAEHEQADIFGCATKTQPNMGLLGA